MHKAAPIGNEVQPDKKVAVQFEGVDFTADQLLGDAERLAAVLAHTDKPVAILLPRGYPLYVSQLAVLLNGGFFVPIDTRDPISRIEFVLQDSQTQIVLTDRTNAARLVGVNQQIDVIDVQPILDSPVDLNAANAAGLDRIDLANLIPHQDGDFIYMIYTSGSTGQPKGVPIHWRAMDNHYQWFIKEYGVGPQDHCMQISSPGFDISIEEIWGSLQIGAKLHVVDNQAYESAEYFWQWVDKNRITILDFSTALWQALLPALVGRSMPESVRLAIIGGEAVSPADIEIWFSVVDPDKVRLSNCYGPTETKITSTYCDLLPGGSVTIGKPIDNMNCVLVDEAGQKIQQPGSPGEIYISGDSVAKGYWNRPEKTAEAFSHFAACDGQWAYRTGDLAHWDDNGDLVFCGRCDDQVKLRGFRIELGEIETAIRLHPEVTNCVVKKLDLGSEQLVAFVCTEQTPASDRDQELSDEITHRLSSALPAYMIPSRFCFMEKFPITANGKIDHAHLAQQLETRESLSKPKWDSQLKNTVAEAWKVATAHYPENDDQSFAQAGGDSLAAMSLITELRKTFVDLRIGIAAIGSQATLNSVSEYIESQSDQSSDSPDSPLITVLKQSNTQSRRWLLLFHPIGGGCLLYERLLTDRILNEFMVVTVESPYLTGPLPRENQNDINSIAATYAEAIAEASQDWTSATQVVTAGYSLGALLAYEVAGLLRERNLPVENVINIDQPVPSSVKRSGIARRMWHWLYRLRQPLIAYRDHQRVQRNRAILDVAQGAFENQHGFSEVEIRSMLLEDYYSRLEPGYQPQRSDLPMQLIRGGIFEAKHLLPEGYGWLGIVNSLDIYRAHGTHSTIFNEPNVHQVQQLFAQAVERTVSMGRDV